MGDILRVLIEVEPADDKNTWKVCFSFPELPGQPASPELRTLFRTQAGDAHFPTVADKASGLPDRTAAHYNLCVGRDMPALAELYHRITQRALVAGQRDTSVFGKYLFDTLIGRTVWSWILERTKHAELLELALAWKSSETDLQRINWEMMHGPHGFLAAKQVEGPREIAITRVVADAAWVPLSARQVPRCLYVIGTSLTDWRIRPGAELLSLLRQIERSGRAIRTRVLRGKEGWGATPTEIMAAMSEFEPDLTHIICHGEFDDSGAAKLEFGADPNEPGERLRPTDGIFNYLNAGKQLPGIVVLSACNTGQSAEDNLLHSGTLAAEPERSGDSNLFEAETLEEREASEVAIRGAHQTAPMAARLVFNGIPIVIGMAGRVSDRACRHFTRRFGEAIVRGEPLVRATAQGRRAAFVHGESAEESVDWAFPAVFMSSGVPPSHVPAPRGEKGMPPVEDWVLAYHPKRGREPAFCGRHEFFDAYFDLFARNKPSVLGAYIVSEDVVPVIAPNSTKLRSGKTRLLRELTVQAIRDGHVPVVVSNDSQNWEPPTTLENLLIELLKALNHARNTYDVQTECPPWQIGLLKQLAKNGPSALDAALREVYEEEKDQVTARVIRTALTIDMTQLLKCTHAKHEFLRDTGGSAILLLDDVDQYPIEFLERWFDGDVLSVGGLRNRVWEPVEGAAWDASRTVLPVVMTFLAANAPKVVLDAVRERGSTLAWMRLEQLRPFPPMANTDLLAMQNVLLNPFDENGHLRPEISNRAFALNHKLDREPWTTWSGYLREGFGGLPGYFETRDFYRVVYIASKHAFFLEADDERKLHEYMKHDADD